MRYHKKSPGLGLWYLTNGTETPHVSLANFSVCLNPYQYTGIIDVDLRGLCHQ